MKLLLIEDNQANAQVYVRLLAQAGYSDVDVHATGVAGLLAAREHRYGAVFIDLDLPDIDGLHVGLALAQSMQRQRMATLPLIALTARADTATLDEAQRLGFNAFIRKPCARNDLETTLQQLLNMKGQVQ